MKRACIMVAVVAGTILGVQAVDARTGNQLESYLRRLRTNFEASVDIGQEKTAEAAPTEIISFTATWCGYCRIQRVHTKALEGRYVVRTVDIDTPEGKALYQKYEGKSVPYTVIVVEGKLKKKFEGVTPPRAIEPFAMECRKHAKTRPVKNSRSRVPGFYAS